MVSLISDFESHLRNQVSSFSASKQHSISKNHRVNILQAEKSQSVLFEYENYVDTLSRTNKLSQARIFNEPSKLINPTANLYKTAKKYF